MFHSCCPHPQIGEWRFIKELHRLQQKQRLESGNKSSSTHIQYQKNKMNVSTAAQALSSSVADAIELLNKGIHLQQFKGSECTVDFI